MTDAERDDLRTWAEAHVPVGSRTAKLVLLLLIELDGYRKANALLNAGMGDVCESRDELKHQTRALVAERDRLAGIWNEAVDTYPQPTPMPGELREWWRRIYERITGGRR